MRRNHGEILGLGITHYPGLTVQGNLCRRIKMCLADPALPERLRSIENWPEPMRRQWSTDEGQAHSDAHGREMIEGFRVARRPLDEAVFLESWISNSDKVFAVFRPLLG